MKKIVYIYLLFFTGIIQLFCAPIKAVNLESPVIHSNSTITFCNSDSTVTKMEFLGSFNNWKPVQMEKVKGYWKYTSPPIAEGTYTYLFKSGNKYFHDPLNPLQNIKPDGSIESIFDIGSGDHYFKKCKSGYVKDNVNELVVVTMNTHSFQENTNRFKKLLWIAEGLKNLNADLICLNETILGNVYSRGYKGEYYNTAAIIRDYLHQLTGFKYYMYVSQIGKWESGEKLANCVLSRFPFSKVDQIELTTTDRWPGPESKRNCLFVEVEIPGGKIIHFFATHTMGWDSQDTLKQIHEIKDFILNKSRRNVFANIVAGDLNIRRSHENYSNWLNDSPRLIDSFLYTKEINVKKNISDGIDYILVGKESKILDFAEIDSVVIFNNNTYNSNFYPVVSDHHGYVTKFKLRN